MTRRDRELNCVNRRHELDPGNDGPSFKSVAQHGVPPDGFFQSTPALGCPVRPPAMRDAMARRIAAMKGASVPLVEGPFRGGGVLRVCLVTTRCPAGDIVGHVPVGQWHQVHRPPVASYRSPEYTGVRTFLHGIGGSIDKLRSQIEMPRRPRSCGSSWIETWWCAPPGSADRYPAACARGKSELCVPR